MPTYTKAQLEEKVALLEKRQKKVVEVALRVKKDRRYCEEVEEILTEAGLGEYLPATVEVQYKESPRGSWYEEDMLGEDTPAHRVAAIRYAHRRRNEAVAEDIRSHSWQVRQAKDRANRWTQYTLAETLTPDTNPNVIADRVKDIIDGLKKQRDNDASVVSSEPEIDKYPVYRVILRKPGQNNRHVTELVRFGQMEKTRLSKDDIETLAKDLTVSSL